MSVLAVFDRIMRLEGRALVERPWRCWRSVMPAGRLSAGIRYAGGLGLML